MHSQPQQTITSESSARRRSPQRVARIEREYLPLEDAAHYLGVGAAKMREFMATGLKYADFGYRSPRFKRAWLDAYAEKRSKQHARSEERREGPRQVP